MNTTMSVRRLIRHFSVPLRMVTSIAAVLLVVADVAQAAPVDRARVNTVAKGFLVERYPSATRAGTSSLRIETVRELQSDAGVIGYVVDLAPYGFVLMRSDDLLPPLKLYYDTGDFEKLPPDFIGVIKWELGRELEELAKLTRERNDPPGLYKKEWIALEDPAVRLEDVRNVPRATAGPLLKTTWNQNSPYNTYAPSAPNGPGGRAYAGCVACAMSQILKFFNQPVAIKSDTGYTDSSGTCKGTHRASDCGLGLANYQWGDMPNALNGGSSSAQINAVAQLMYHCGVAVRMDFEADGSGAYSVNVVTALRNLFYYECADYAGRGNNNAQWYNRINQDITANRPIYYDMQSAAGGHAIVCDGCRNNTEIHLNFGWGGAANAWYNMDYVNGGGQVWVNHSAIFGIEPVSTESRMIREIVNNYTVTPTVSLMALPAFDVAQYSVTETLADGITPTNITVGGTWDDPSRTITWSAFSDNQPRTLTYQVQGPEGKYALAGAGDFDGELKTTTGPNEVSIHFPRLIPLATRSISNDTVTLRIYPDDACDNHGVREAVPDGLTPIEITDGGLWVPSAGVIDWGPYDGLDVETLNYKLISWYGDENFLISGIARFDTNYVEITGDSIYGGEDTDGDGLPDWWEIQYFNVLDYGADDDPDSDGYTNIEEWLAGFDPTDPTSKLQIQDASVDTVNGKAVVRWPSAASRRYTIERTRDLGDSFDVLDASVLSTPPMNSYTDTVQDAASPAFYRVKVHP